MIKYSARYEELISPDRNRIIARRILEDSVTMFDAGIPPDVIRHSLTSFQYVQVFLNTPRLFYPVEKLPRGAKWADGKKLSEFGAQVTSKACPRPNYQFLPFEDDLYIKPVALPLPIGTPAEKSQIVRIPQWRDLTAYEAMYYEVADMPEMDYTKHTDVKKPVYKLPNGLAHLYEHAKIEPSLEDAILRWWNYNGLPIRHRSILRTPQEAKA